MASGCSKDNWSKSLLIQTLLASPTLAFHLAFSFLCSPLQQLSIVFLFHLELKVRYVSIAIIA